MKRKGQTTYEGMSLGVTPPTADLYRSTRSLCEPRAGSSEAQFGVLCKGCPLRDKCTESKAGRTVYIHPKHRVLERSRRRQREPGWRARYRGTRPKVERKLAPMMRRKHGGRRARMRGRLRVGHDFAQLAAAINLARLAMLGVRRDTAPTC